MRSGFLKACVCALLILASASGSPWCQGESQTAQPPPILSKPLASFEVVHLCPLDALLQLGQEAGVPLGIEYVDREAVEERISVTLGETTVGGVLEELLGPRGDYRWRIEEGVVDITRAGVPSGKQNLLDLRIREFSAPRCSLADASHLLYSTLEAELHPEAGGSAGDYAPGDMQNVVGPIRMRNVPVRQVLNRLVGQSKNAAWIVQVLPYNLDKLPSSGLWAIVEYETTPVRYGELLRRTLFGRGNRPAHERHD